MRFVALKRLAFNLIHLLSRISREREAQQVFVIQIKGEALLVCNLADNPPEARPPSSL